MTMQASINTDTFGWDVLECNGFITHTTFKVHSVQECNGFITHTTFKVHSVGQAASVKCKVCSRVKFYCISSVTYGQVVTIPNCVHPFVQQGESRTIQPLQFQQF